jgi:hypothetical protein
MAGLLSKKPVDENAAAGAETRPPGKAIPQSQEDSVDELEKPGPQTGGTNVTPNEQEAYELFMAQVGNVMYDKKTLPKLIERLHAGAKAAESIGQTAAAIVMRVQDSAEESGRRVDPDILLAAGKEAVEMLGELAERSGIDVTDEVLEQAYLLGVDQFRAIRQQQGKLAPEAFQQDMNFLKQADEEGRIDEVAPGLTTFAQKARPQPGAEPAEEQPDEEEGEY